VFYRIENKRKQKRTALLKNNSLIFRRAEPLFSTVIYVFPDEYSYLLRNFLADSYVILS